MKHFIIATNPAYKLTMVAVVERKPKTVDKDGFELKFHTELTTPQMEDGARVLIEKMDAHFGVLTKHTGVYATPYENVAPVFDDFVKENLPKAEGARSWWIRVPAGIAAALLTVAMGFVATGGMMFWLVVCAFKRQSGIMTMAETAVVWRILDWTPLIRYLVRIALGR